jgi:hypothetical protein
MSSLAFSDFNEEPNHTNIIQQKKREGMRHNKTVKRKEKQSNPKLEAMMKRIHEGDGVDDDDVDTDMNNYQPLSPPKSGVMEHMDNMNKHQHIDDDNMDHDMNGRIESQYEESQQLQQPQPQLRRQSSQQEMQQHGNNQEAFTQLPSEYAKQYYQQYIPYYNQSSDDRTPSGANKDELLSKLNQIIYLLEEQQEEKTDNVMEELILYSFLGIFIIFVVDSFARAGKYVR